MAYVGEMLLDDGQIVLLEVAGDGPAGVQRVSRGAVVAGAAETLQQALARVRPALGAVVDGARALPRPPGSVTVEFGITLSAEAGVVVARGSTEAHFTVSMHWTHQDESTLPGQRDGADRP
ncbi:MULTISPECIES: CU044_2847 family protein [Streptomyces]|uniref:Trypsin-co-occurring domain-containing protein n=1 Tax=Streptomyces plumbiresistens TaxID=511811 RepID=A0ABP7SZG9_9ACTN|nr:CU044_2847 family protein [Streptomyces sp. NBC_01373]MCX4701843.1 CU044_2847 family protein [Streptomyces sp. NBC_01373]